MDARLFDRARECGDIEAVAGVPLFRAGRRLRGECPLCGASKGKRSGGAFSVDPDGKVFKCFACDAGGDVVRLEQLLGGGSPAEAAERLAGTAPAAPRRPAPERAARETAESRWKAQTAASLWRQAAAAGGTPVETYLRSRGIDGCVLAAALERLRFHPAAYHSGSGQGEARLPAMVALVVTPGERGARMTGGVHVTYLAPDGRGKTARQPAKRMWGPQGRDGRPGLVWLSDPRGGGPLIVAEGIESGLSAAMLAGEAARVAATLSLRALQGGWLADAWGRVNPDCPRADPEHPAATWPADALGGDPDVVLAVDRDMSPIRVKVRAATGGTVERVLDAEDRARVCAALAIQQWTAAGVRRVRAIAPGMGRDFNDELRARHAPAGSGTSTS